MPWKCWDETWTIWPSSRFIYGISQSNFRTAKEKDQNLPHSIHTVIPVAKIYIYIFLNPNANDKHGIQSWHNINQTHLRSLVSTEIVTKRILFCHNLKFVIPCSLSEGHMEKKHFKWVFEELQLIWIPKNFTKPLNIWLEWSLLEVFKSLKTNCYVKKKSLQTMADLSTDQ